MKLLRSLTPLGLTTSGHVVPLRDQAGSDPARESGIPVVAPLAVLTALSWAAFGASPWLLSWPLLLIALNPRMLFLLLVAPKLGLFEFTLVASLRLCLADPFSYLLGVRYGARLRDRLEQTRMRRMLLRVIRVERTAAWCALWLRPSQLMLAWAGSLGLRPRSVAAVDIATTVAYVVAIHQGLSLVS